MWEFTGVCHISSRERSWGLIGTTKIMVIVRSQKPLNNLMPLRTSEHYIVSNCIRYEHDTLNCLSHVTGPLKVQGAAGGV